MLYVAHYSCGDPACTVESPLPLRLDPGCKHGRHISVYYRIRPKETAIVTVAPRTVEGLEVPEVYDPSCMG